MGLEALSLLLQEIIVTQPVGDLLLLLSLVAIGRCVEVRCMGGQRRSTAVLIVQTESSDPAASTTAANGVWVESVSLGI